MDKPDKDPASQGQGIKRVIYCGAFRYPRKDAASLRVLSIGKALRDIGYTVEFIGWSEPENAEPDRKMDRDGFWYQSLAELGSGGALFSRLIGYLNRGKHTLNQLKQGDIDDVHAIICYNGTGVFLRKLNAFCRSRSIPLFIDCTEWYDPTHLPGGKWGPVSLDEKLRMHWVTPKIGRGIVISRYLHKFFLKKGLDTVIIPPTVDLSEKKWPSVEEGMKKRKKKQGEPLRLVYAGSPGKKDKIEWILSAMIKAQEKGCVTHLTLVGPTQEQLKQISPAMKNLTDILGKSIDYRGRVQTDQVPVIVQEAHFSIILREDARYAAAGFPTKLVESQAVGTPVITTVTGDEGVYIKDRQNGFTVQPPRNADDLVPVLQEAANLSEEDWMQMVEKSHQSAMNSFDYHCYNAELEDLLTRARM